MASISTTVEIDRPIEEVFDYLTNLDNAPEWSVEVVDVRHDGPFQVGATGQDVRMMGKKQVTMPWTVTEFEPPHRMVLDYTEPFPINAAFLFASTPSGGTRVTCNTEMKPTGRWKLHVAADGKRRGENRPDPIREGQTDSGEPSFAKRVTLSGYWPA